MSHVYQYHDMLFYCYKRYQTVWFLPGHGFRVVKVDILHTQSLRAGT